MVSILIPIYNEEKILSKTLAGLQRLSAQAEIIFIDGGSSDRSVEIAAGCGRVEISGKGRAVQMNHGARFAKNNTLLFLHADSVVSSDTLTAIERKIMEGGFIGGCLTQRINKDACIFRFIEAEGNLRARITKIFYGDQGIFVKKDMFSKIGGFPEVPILEDVLFTKKLRRIGKTAVLPQRIIVSPRRWEKQGIIKTTFLYSLITILFRLRFPLDKIKRLYDDLR